MLNTVQKFEQTLNAYTSSIPINKEVFQSIRDLILYEGSKTILDIGCANGDFLYFLPDDIRCVGIDKSEELISLAKSRCKNNSTFYVADMLDVREKWVNVNFGMDSIDTITCIGTMQSFIDYWFALKTLIKLPWQKNLILHVPLNPNGIDTIHFHKPLGVEDYQCAFNIPSIASLVDFIENQKLKCSISPFMMKNTLNKNNADLLRSYHVAVDNEKKIINGLQILIEEYIVVITR